MLLSRRSKNGRFWNIKKRNFGERGKSQILTPLFGTNEKGRETMKCIIYSRVSTEEQNTENQTRLLKDYAERQGWEIFEVVSEEAVSGGVSVFIRKESARILQLARQRRFDVLLTYSCDRITRNGATELLLFLQKLSEYKVKFVSYTEEYISSLGDYAPIVLSILGVLGKMEKQKISLRTKASLSRLQAKGVKLGRPNKCHERTAEIQTLRTQGKTLGEIIKLTGMTKSSVWRIIKATA